jgi:hypothetical protein
MTSAIIEIMDFTEHAARRILERFPGVALEEVIREFVAARPPTPAQTHLVIASDRSRQRRPGQRLVSPSGMIFVVDADVVVTVFPMMTDAQYRSFRRRQRAQNKPWKPYEKRRLREPKKIIGEIE